MKPRTTCGVLLPLFALSLLVTAVPESAMGQFRADQFAGMSARSIGPARTIGGISAIDVVVADPNVVYVGAVRGGLWKSANGGQTWRAVFDDQPVSDISAVVINQTRPDVIWVGIGEGNGTRDPTVPGVFRSVDAGETWVPGGLPGLGGVHQLLLHPVNPLIAFAGVSGRKWEAGEGRGVYRTGNGGRTWNRVLFVDQSTGVSDLVMDPSDPERLLAAMSSRRVTPWSIEPRGPGSGLFLTRNGGETWIRLGQADGLPAGDLGRISMDFFRGDPRVVHALVDSGEGVLLRSLNRGRTWQTVSSGPDLTRPLDDPNAIVADPLTESRLFHLTSRLSVSDDGGSTFKRGGRGAGPGYRVLWIHPEDPRLMYGGTDRGLYVSRDGGEHWVPAAELPIGRFTHVSVDMQVPFNVYGGLERNGSWMGPAYGWAAGGAPEIDWMELGSEDGFGVLVDASEENRGYAVTQSGDLIRFNTQTGERKPIRPWTPVFTDLRINRDVPIALDPHNPAALYFGSQFVHKSLNRGETWQIISGDLTANDPAGRRMAQGDSPEAEGLATDAQSVVIPDEGGATITVIAPSPLDRDLIWVGTDEGDVQITRSAGGEWVSVRDRIDDVPDSSWVSHIEPSAFRPGSAIVAFDDHRTGNREPLVAWTDNFGLDWTTVRRTSEFEGVVHTVKQDPGAADLLFAGTDAGLYISLNGGENWSHWTHGLPTVPVHDLVVHPRDNDLVIATYGRGAYVIDDIRPLQELARNPRIAEVEIFLFELAPTFIRSTRASDRGGPSAMDVTNRGEDRPSGVLLSYWLGSGPPEEGGDTQNDVLRIVDRSPVTVEILDFAGRVVRTFPGRGEPGLNRVAWDLREDTPTLTGPIAQFSDVAIGDDEIAVPAVEVLPGLFSVRISRAGAEGLQWLEVLEDPLLDVEILDRIAKYQAVKRGLLLDARYRALRAAIASVQSELRRVRTWVRGRGPAGDMTLLETSQALADELVELADFQNVMRYRPGVLGLTLSYDTPTEGQRLDLIRMEEELDGLTRSIGDFLILDIALFSRRVEQAGLDVSFFIGPIG